MVIVIATFFILLAGYIYFEAQMMLRGPKLVIESPTETTCVSDQTFTVRGVSQDVASLSVNGTPVAITTEGLFGTRLLLAPGYNTIVLTALDTLGRETSKVLSVVYTPPASETEERSAAVVGTLTTNDDLL